MRFWLLVAALAVVPFAPVVVFGSRLTAAMVGVSA